MFWRDVQLRREAIERGMRDTARALSLAVDREVGSIQAVAQTLAASPSIAAGDFKAFYELSRGAAEMRRGSLIALFDQSGQMIINTGEPFGTLLPNPVQKGTQSSDRNQGRLPLGNQAIKKVLQTGLPLYSDLFMGLVSKLSLLSVTVPVIRNEKIAYAISMAMTTDRLTSLLREQGLPAGWIAVLVDKKGIIVARTAAPEKFVSRPTSASLIRHLSEADEGWDSGRDQEGTRIYYSFARSKLTGWGIAIGAPLAAIDGPVNRSILIMTGGATLLLLVAFGAAFVFGRHISVPVSRLAQFAEAIQRGEKIELDDSAVAEVRQLHRALLEASATARAADAERERRLVADAKRAEAERAQEALRESEERFRLMANSAPVMIWLAGTDKKCSWFNNKWLEFVGRSMEQEIGDGWVENVHPADLDRCYQTFVSSFDAREPFSMEYRIRRSDGQYRWILDNGIPRYQPNGEFLGYIGSAFDLTERKQAEKGLKRFADELESRVAERTEELRAANAALLRDIEERKKLEAQLVQSQKMESIGTLAGGIAHDFNNILNIIHAYAFLLAESGGQKEQMDESIKVINDTVQRGAALVQQLLAVAQKTSGTRFVLLDINSLIEGLIKLVRETFPKTIEVNSSLAPELPVIMGDKTQIEQVLLNLFVNARDAMPEGGELTFKTFSRDNASLQFGKTTADRYVCIEIIDTGIGMDESTRNRIFEPFFSTKDKSQRAGLGLSVVYGIVRNHEGFIDVETKPMGGAIFRVYLPVMAASELVAADSYGDVRSVVEKFSNCGTILIVEDELMALNVLERVLSRRGYKILKAAEGDAAVRIFEQNKDLVDVVVLDIGLPKIPGKEVLLKIKALKPTVKIIIASGYFEADLRSDITQASIAAFLQKPYMMENVINTIQRVIERES